MQEERYFQWRYAEDTTPVVTLGLTPFIKRGAFHTVGDLKSVIWMMKVLPGATGPGDVKFIGHLDAQDTDLIEEEFGNEGKTKENPFTVQLLKPLPPLDSTVIPRAFGGKKDVARLHGARAQTPLCPGR
ncbi:unnamed protein product [Vitrella brassicaformis CCMP3155]|uniref:Uncharacterized protein n=2 Tax=Vitrella brassicaformis TaxID=1169539 RepID=A0A0G4G6H6_VITBC|nr:unnamed protein product [Vitrella brassicaformis CCMP3155]|eukprot:CEM23860.1 unnamed protein product [Vitrella brassicaformis CCMP3155]